MGQRPGRPPDVDTDMRGNMQIKTNAGRHAKAQPVFLTKTEAATKDRSAFLNTCGVITKANGKPTVKDYIDALKKICSSYAAWEWKHVPIANGVLFRFPSEGNLNLLTKREVIPCNNGHFVVSRWKGDGEGFNHRFPVRASVLAFNIPPYLRSEQELARMVVGFAHLIEADQVLEEGGPMKMILRCRRSSDIPRELPIIFGGREFRVALTITMGEKTGYKSESGIGKEGEQRFEDMEDHSRQGRGRTSTDDERLKTTDNNTGLDQTGMGQTRAGRQRNGGGGPSASMDALSSNAIVGKLSDLGHTGD